MEERDREECHLIHQKIIQNRIKKNSKTQNKIMKKILRVQKIQNKNSILSFWEKINLKGKECLQKDFLRLLLNLREEVLTSIIQVQQ